MKNTSPLLGLGNDIIEIQRIRKSIEKYKDHFLDRLFSAKEKEYCFKFQDPAPHFAARFCAKEAASKALGTGFGADLSWRDLEVQKEPIGKPFFLLSEKANERFDHPLLLLSMSHSHEYAMATVLWISSSQKEKGSR